MRVRRGYITPDGLNMYTRGELASVVKLSKQSHATITIREDLPWFHIPAFIAHEFVHHALHWLGITTQRGHNTWDAIDQCLVTERFFKKYDKEGGDIHETRRV